MNSWNILKKFLKVEKIVRYSNGWNPLSSKPQIKKIKEYHAKKGGDRQGRTQVASTSKPQVNQPPQEGKKKKGKELEETIFTKLQDSKNPKRFYGKCFQHGQNLYGIQGQRETNNEKTPFPKNITLSPDILDTLTEIKNSILTLKYITNSLLSSKEINNNLLALTQIVVQNKKEINNLNL
ncbi:hypothetical protein O181_116371 [Austropuccinia psidii MF-1]|uniref:Uncharacterized protein n=1 Tax=Austropuccinia psidii MF-1 TaxID=1389203 RepID=A0A9Q3KAM2_9BASI|nr:hypothetical protein [Austropuccinia psidii MF-1]